MARIALLADALYNVKPNTGGSDDYARGLVVGAVSALMAATGKDFEAVVPVIAENLPATFDPGRLPGAFRSEIVDEFDKLVRAKIADAQARADIENLTS